MTIVNVINPNASEIVTQAIRTGLADYVDAVRCHTSTKGPLAIESHADFEAAQGPLADLAEGLAGESTAIVVACFSDPGVADLRAKLPCHVIGIQEAAAQTAIDAGQRFGIVAIVDASVERQQKALTARGQTEMWAGSRALGLGVAELDDADIALPRIIEVATELRDKDGAEVLILGCAGMGNYRDAVAKAVGLPVIDPTRAAVERALQGV